MNKSILASALILASTSAFALEGDHWINLHIGSQHSDPGFYEDDTNDFYEYEESNPGIGYEYEATDNKSFRVGTYRNSLAEQSVYLGGNFHTKYTDGIAVGVMLGLSTGYERQYGMTVTGIVLPNVMVIIAPVRIELGYVPAIGKFGSVATLTAGIQF